MHSIQSRRVLFAACCTLAFIAPAFAQTVYTNFSGPFGPSNWYTTGSPIFSFAGSTLTLPGGSSAQILSPYAGTVSFNYSGVGSYGFNGPYNPISGSGSASFTLLTPNTYFGFNNMGFGSPPPSLTISNFSFVTAPPVLTSDLSVSNQNINVALLVDQNVHSVSIPVTISNAGPQSASYTIDDGVTSPLITRVGLPFGNVPPNQTLPLFNVVVDTDTVGAFTTIPYSYRVTNTSDSNDAANTVSVNRYISSPPQPGVYIPLGNYSSPPVKDLSVFVDEGAGPILHRDVAFQDTFTPPAFNANARLITESPDVAPFTSNPYPGGYELAPGSPNADPIKTFSIDTTNLLAGTYNSTYTAVWGVGYASGSNVQITNAAGLQYPVSVQLSATVLPHLGNGHAPLPPNAPLTGITADSSTLHVEFLAGNAPAAGADVGLSFLPQNSSSLFAADANHTQLGDVVQITGVDGTHFVLQLTYTLADLDDAHLTPASLAANPVNLEWFDTSTNSWRLAVDDNSSTHEAFFSSPFDPTLDVLGNYGSFYDPATQTGSAWAVLDHNSYFSLSAAVPEPASLSLLALATPLLTRRRRTR